jgi:GNAT superfamily N-acetyltransferase
MITLKLRDATQHDASAIALLHTKSWSTAYRGLLPDSYLDDNLLEERTRHWNWKLSSLSQKEFVLLAWEENELIGFAAVTHKPERGYEALLDNLHVLPTLKGKGLGSILIKAVALRLSQTGRKNFYLWVLQGNTPAEAFYKSRGGTPADQTTGIFGGKTVYETRFVWDNLEALLD